MTNLVKKLNRNPVFKFLSSVRLAVPLMLAMAATVAAGTIFESRYNTDYARLMVYQTNWFQFLLAGLWTNIFCATISRIPFKKHHTGFVITHIGLLTLLFGSLLTGTYGIDGQLRIEEGQKSGTVVLPNLIIGYAAGGASRFSPIHFSRSLSELDKNDLKSVNEESQPLFTVEKFIPFAEAERKYVAGVDPSRGVGVGFRLKSPFFDVSESLHSLENPEMQMGPALMKIVVDSPRAAAKGPVKRDDTRKHAEERVPMNEPQSKFKKSGASKEDVLVISKVGAKEPMKTLKVSELLKTPATIGPITITAKRVFKSATVGSKGIEEGGGKPNPAIELIVTHQGKSVREVSFANYPDFSMNKDGVFGLHFVYRIAGQTPQQTTAVVQHGQSNDNAEETSGQGGGMGQLPPGHPPIGGQSGQSGQAAEAPTEATGETAAARPAMGNVIEFHVSPDKKDEVRLEFYKDGKLVSKETAKNGATVDGPWMGMKFTITSVAFNSEAIIEAKQVQLQPRHPMPSSAIFVKPGTDSKEEGFWLVEGESRNIRVGDRDLTVYFGRDTIDLPFAVQLDKFKKVDYPGTETAMSYESTVEVDGFDKPLVISMNEPLHHMGYTLYQASYELRPGFPPASIFSVNKDPGRPLKYIGSLILVIGIMTFIGMRSRLARPARKFPHTATTALFAVLLAGAAFFTSARTFAATPPAVVPDVAAHEAAVTNMKEFDPAAAEKLFRGIAESINVDKIRYLPLQDHGRVKPLDTLAREAMLFVTGKYSLWGLDPVQMYLATLISDVSPSVELIEVRDPKLRKKLALPSDRRRFSQSELSKSTLSLLAQPLIEKEKQDEKSLNEEEKKTLEAYSQMQFVDQIHSGEHLLSAADFAWLMHTQNPTAPSGGSPVVEQTKKYLTAVARGNVSEAAIDEKELLDMAKTQPMPEVFERYRDKISWEVMYNHVRFFFWAGILYCLVGALFAFPMTRRKIGRKTALALFALPLIMHITGFALRVYITGFAPVTSMYGTMVWVGFGVTLLSLILLFLYENYVVAGLLAFGSGAIMLLTESIPLILSPDLDPIVAVLRSNYWLTIHVLTITFSYAAFTVAMLIGNTALIRTLLKRDNAAFYKEYAHYAYRMMQAGVLFITAGIILGGIWADYSWGRFWGWDPKETWALIADVGFLAILHARYVGWLRDFGTLAAAPVAYLLVIMAWYGVNFILAAGLHSYGFSSGGTAVVIGFVAAQFVVFGLALARAFQSRPSIKTILKG